MTNLEGMTVSDQARWLVRPREDWFGLDLVNKALVEIFYQFERMDMLAQECRELSQICDEGTLGQHVEINHSERGIRGLKDANPQHAALYVLGARNEVRVELWQLMCLILKTIAEWESRIESLEFPQREQIKLNRRSRTVWPPIWLIENAGIDLLPPVTANAWAFYEALDDRLAEMDPREIEALGQNYRYLEEIHRFFKNFFGKGKEVYTRSTTSTADMDLESRAVNVGEAPESSDSDLHDGVGDRMVATQRSRDQLQKTPHLKAGNAPTEVEDGPTLITSPESVNVDAGSNPVRAAVRLANRKIHQKRGAQLLPGRWSTLTDAELSSVLKLMVAEARYPGSVGQVLLLMLLTGRELEGVLRMRLVRTVDQLPKQPPEDSPVYLVSERQKIAVLVQKPEGRRSIREEWRQVLTTHEAWIFLPILVEFWAVLHPLVQTREASINKRSVELFHGAGDSHLEIEVRDEVSKMNRGHRGRITLPRLSYQLTEALHRETGDLVSALLVTGRQPPYGTSASLYYQHSEHEHLVRCYAEVMERWQALMDPGNRANQVYQPDMLTGSVGSDLALQTHIAVEMFDALYAQVKNDRALVGTGRGLRYFHNALTNYTLMLIFWLTGYRAVHDPIAEATEYNKRRGLLVINDKTGDGHGHSRMVPVADVLAGQLAEYQRHAAWLKNRLALYGRHKVGTELFYLDESMKQISVSPASIKKFIEWAYVLPLNLSRHWLRGHLIGMGVPGPHVDRFMGHWSLGQEPWGRYSAVCPDDFCTVLRDALNRLAVKLRLRVIGGVV